MKDLSVNDMKSIYDEGYFIEQIRAAGVPNESIEEMLATHPKNDSNDNLVHWLYKDILADETMFINGKRVIMITGIYCTDGENILLEREPLLASKGKKFSLGGLLAFGEDSYENALKELREETPLDVNDGVLDYIGEIQGNSISSKVPRVLTRRTGFIYKFTTNNPFPLFPELYRGSDDAYHELITVHKSKLLMDPRVEKSFKDQVMKYSKQLNH